MKTKAAVLVGVIAVALLQTASGIAQTGKSNHAAFTPMWSAPAAQAINPPYLSGMPTAERVTREIQGKDPIDTAARQAGVFWQLRKVIYDIALSQRRTDRQVTPDEKRLADVYYAAYYNVWLPVEKSLSQDRPGLFKLQGYTVDDRLLDEVFTKCASPAVRAEYTKANAAFAARRKQVVEEGKAQQARAQADVQNYVAQQQPKPWQRELARCIASGRSETQCLAESLGKGATELFPILKKTPLPSGLRMSGVYAAQGGFSMTFYPEGAVVECKGVPAQGDYAVEVKDNHVRVKLLPPVERIEAVANLLPQAASSNGDEWQGQRIAFPLRPDGKMLGSGTIQVTGRVAVGQTTEQAIEQKEKRILPSEAAGYNRLDVHRDGLGLYVEERVTVNKTVPVYETRTQRCALGLLTATGNAPVLGSMSTGLAATLNLAFGGDDKSAGKVPPPGLRMNGQYVGQGGFDIEFHPESAVVACRQAVIAREYSLSMSGNQVLVNIQDAAKPIVLEIRPDGTLAGSGPVQVNGRVLLGTNANNEPVFQPASDTCTLGVLSPGSAGSASTATSEQPGAAPRPSGTGGAATPAKPSGAGGIAVLTMTLGIPNRPGQALLPGQIFLLLNENFETALKQQGFEPAAGSSILKSAGLCSTATPNCQKVAAAITAHSVGVVRVDPEGKATFPGVAAGTYFLVSRVEYPAYSGRLLMFNLRVDLKPGANSVTVDQQNATPTN